MSEVLITEISVDDDKLLCRPDGSELESDELRSLLTAHSPDLRMFGKNVRKRGGRRFVLSWDRELGDTPTLELFGFRVKLGGCQLLAENTKTAMGYRKVLTERNVQTHVAVICVFSEFCKTSSN